MDRLAAADSLASIRRGDLRSWMRANASPGNPGHGFSPESDFASARLCILQVSTWFPEVLRGFFAGLMQPAREESPCLEVERSNRSTARRRSSSTQR